MPAAHRSDGRRPLEPIERVTAVGVVVSAAELLRSRVHDDDGILSWDVARTRHRWMGGRLEPVLRRAFGATGVRALLLGRIVAAAVLVSPVRSPGVRMACDAYLAASGYALTLRSPYGGDGAESVTTLTTTTVAIARGCAAAERPAIAFLAAQAMLSYAVAGVSKLASPMWMDGTAIRDVLRTRIFGDERLFALVRRSPMLCLVAGRAVALAELLAPLILLLDPSRRRVALAGMAAAHLGVAVVMGLNRFPWAFVGTYPAVMAVARRGA